GGIAAYKSASLVSGLKSLGAEVWVVMTSNSQKIVSPLLLRTLSGNPVITDLFDEKLADIRVPHISLTRRASLLVIAPCTASMIGKMANGIADDALSTMALSFKGKTLIAPAMNEAMWKNPVVKKNCNFLKSLGYSFIGPAEGRLACGQDGLGRMVEPENILDKIISLLTTKQDLKGKHILITAGATQEPIDPVRYITNRSSGKMGYALARAAVDRGAEVTLISGPTQIDPPPVSTFIQISSAQEMFEAVINNYSRTNIVIMAAAVADYKPKISFWQKLKKQEDHMSLDLSRTQDILEYLGRNKNGCFLVGFSLETENLENNALEKMRKKNLDLVVANDTSAFESDISSIKIIKKTGEIEDLKLSSKLSLANAILDRIQV
ncbi:MAG: bifunctional phosphopantothenoylcysteine decarboxylase/phosphopantothenate--cysteine ligase CoaBC, partial [Candidatus Margulisbacteria bacterium]|nr:bifunctional phosphopantothenoylcysteine decarboxylase/phosphopantothenate--cysteine ligase CoaBC [Candidatus Margulisiibacteriota bacterium]